MNERARAYLERVLAAAHRMEQLIEDLMRLSRVNGADLRRTTINVSKMVASIIADLQSREPERHVETSICDELYAYRARESDRQRVEVHEERARTSYRVRRIGSEEQRLLRS
jgi:signal transduction histidine kinase